MITACLATFAYVACIVLIIKHDAEPWVNVLYAFYVAFGGTIVLNLWGLM